MNRPLVTGVRTLLAVLLVMGTGWADPAGLRAQDARTLDRVAELSDEGRIEQARSLLLEWWDASAERAPDAAMQRALLLRGRLTVDPEIARMDFQRIVDEYPSGEVAAAARLRLALLSEAGGDLDGAEEQLRELLRAHPDSPLRFEVRDRLEELTEGENERGEPAAAGRGERGNASRGGTRGRQAPPPVARHAAQLGTYQTASEAVILARRAIEAGFEARLVRIEGSELVRVRVGRYMDPLEASRLLVTLRSAGFSAAAVENADREVPIGGGTRR